MLSKFDDFPIHQISDPVRYPDTSDRNFYDRYYFNMFNKTGEIMVIFGLGQYPNRGVQDAYVLVHHGDTQQVVRASKPLGDRSDISVGPIRIEIIEGLQKLRVVLEKNEYGIEMDVVWNGEHKAFLEPRHLVRTNGRVTMNTMRFAQLGTWTGTLKVGGKTFNITPDQWLGSRDRSWGVRPRIGEADATGIEKEQGMPAGFGLLWNYFPVLFKDFVLMYIVNEYNGGKRNLEEALRVWKDPNREPEHLGRPEHDHVFNMVKNYKSDMKEAVVRFSDAPGGPLELRGTPLLQTYLNAGSGYDMEPGWRHGMYQGPDLVVQNVTYNYLTDQDRMWGVIDSPARYTLNGEVGYGLMEFGVYGNFEKYSRP